MELNLHPDMEKFLDKRLESNGLAQDALRRKDARLLMVLAAEACVGIKEATGHNDGKMVVLVQETVGGAVKEPYCVSGVMTCAAYAAKKTGQPCKLVVTEHAQTLWNKTPKGQRVKFNPLPGAVAVWADKGKTSGHAEIVRSSDEAKFQAVGFNTSGSTKPGGQVDREGNGVYFTVRARKSSANRKLLGFLKPF